MLLLTNINHQPSAIPGVRTTVQSFVLHRSHALSSASIGLSIGDVDGLFGCPKTLVAFCFQTVQVGVPPLVLRQAGELVVPLLHQRQPRSEIIRQVFG